MRTGFITAMVAATVVSACSPYDLAPGDTDLGLSDRSSLARVEYQYHVGDQPAADGMGPVVMTLRPTDRDCAEARRWAYRYPDDHFTAYGYAIRDGVGRADGWCPPMTAMRPLPPRPRPNRLSRCGQPKRPVATPGFWPSVCLNWTTCASAA